MPGFIPATDGFIRVTDGFIPVRDGSIPLMPGFIPATDGFIPATSGFIRATDGLIPATGELVAARTSSSRATRCVIERHDTVLGGAELGSRRCSGRLARAWQRPFSWVPPS
jgi:hypothetical protein